MLTGTIIMMTVIVVFIYGGAGWLMKLNLQCESKRKLQESSTPNGDS